MHDYDAWITLQRDPKKGLKRYSLWGYFLLLEFFYLNVSCDCHFENHLV